jgi:RNA-directed DNA polymerase
VLDRFIQQAAMQVLQAAWDRTFSEHSHGFRPGRSAQGAVRAAQAYITAGDCYVVDIDLEKFFDRVNHDILMGLVAKRVHDQRILRLIRGFLTAGVLADGLVGPTDEGTPQGGPLSPLLSNLMLDGLDRELERRGHRFVRYADDCNIYVRSRRAGERVMASVGRFLARHLKLGINAAKSAVDHPSRRKFLGFSFTAGTEPRRCIAPQSLVRFKSRVRELTRRTGGASLDVARTRPVGPATASCHRLDAVEARAYPLCGAAPPRRRQGPGGKNRRQSTRPLATQQQPCACHRAAQRFPTGARPRRRRYSAGRLIH